MTLDCKIGLNFCISHHNMYKLAKLSSNCLLLFNCEDIAYHNISNGFENVFKKYLIIKFITAITKDLINYLQKI